MRTKTLSIVLFVLCCFAVAPLWAADTDSLEPVADNATEGTAVENAECPTGPNAGSTALEPGFGEQINWVGPGQECLADCRIVQRNCLVACGTDQACISFCQSEYDDCVGSCSGGG